MKDLPSNGGRGLDGQMWRGPGPREATEAQTGFMGMENGRKQNPEMSSETFW